MLRVLHLAAHALMLTSVVRGGCGEGLIHINPDTTTMEADRA
jgi:hypothetical protein